MIDRLELQLSGLQCPEAAFDDHQAFVSGCSIFRRGERVIIGLNDPLAISASRTLDSICVESYVATLCSAWYVGKRAGQSPTAGLSSDSYAALVPLSAVRRLQADAGSGGELRAGCNRRDTSGVAPRNRRR